MVKENYSTGSEEILSYDIFGKAVTETQFNKVLRALDNHPEFRALTEGVERSLRITEKDLEIIVY